MLLESEQKPHFRHPAVIFDRDGTLINTEGVLKRARMSAVRKFFGIDMTEEMNEANLGRSAPAMFTSFLEEFGGDPARLEDMVSYMRRLYNNMYENEGIEPMPGAIQLIRDLKREGLRLAIGTGGNKVQASHLLELAGFDVSDFEYVVSRGDVYHDKPTPEIFLHAAGSLHIAPFECVVVGDSINDLIAARLSGMPTIFYNPKGIDDFRPNVSTVTDLSKITNDLIQSL